MKQIVRPNELDVPSFRYGIFIAAELASQYDSSSSHPYKLQDCIMGKLNMLPKRKVRKNPNGRKIDEMIDRIEKQVSSIEATMKFMEMASKSDSERIKKFQEFLRWAMGINPRLWDKLPKNVRDQWKKLAQ
jgi:hypothetical protein